MSARGRNVAAHQQDAVGAYDTPLGVTRAAWAELAKYDEIQNVRRVLEPHVGAGNWLRTIPDDLRAKWSIEIMDVDPLAPAIQEADIHGWEVTPCAPAQSLMRSGFLVTEPRERPDVVVGNPPYSLIPPRVHCAFCEGWVRKESERVTAGVKGSGVLPFCTYCDGTGRLQPPAIFVATHHLVRALRVTQRHVVFLLRVGYIGSRSRAALLKAAPPRHEWRLIPRPRFRWGGSDASEYDVLWWDIDWLRAKRRTQWTTSILDWSAYAQDER